jgi:REP element-mobilizing transposase RayT
MKQDDPIAYFLTWTTYGTWLPGDARGWHDGDGLWHSEDQDRTWESNLRMTEDAVRFNKAQRQLVEATVARHCEIRGWMLHAVNCRTNHVHVVVTATGVVKQVVLEQFKAWCTRKLKEQSPGLNREQWWTEGGSKREVYSEEAMIDLLDYVLNQQEGERFPGS